MRLSILSRPMRTWADVAAPKRIRRGIASMSGPDADLCPGRGGEPALGDTRAGSGIGRREPPIVPFAAAGRCIGSGHRGAGVPGPGGGGGGRGGPSCALGKGRGGVGGRGSGGGWGAPGAGGGGGPSRAAAASASLLISGGGSSAAEGTAGLNDERDIRGRGSASG